MHGLKRATRRPNEKRSRRRVAWIAPILAAVTTTAGLTAATGLLATADASADSVVGSTAHNPKGVLGVAVSGRRVHFYGSATDIDGGPVRLVYYLNGTPREIVQTHNARFSRTWVRPYGTWTVKVVALNAGAGTSNTALGSRTVKVLNPATRNPRGHAHFAHTSRTVYVRGNTYDPDRMGSRLFVRVLSNGHTIGATYTRSRTHNYVVRGRLRAGMNHIVVVSRNIGPGTHNTVNGRTTLRGAGAASWAAAYHGNQRVAARMLPRFGWGKIQMPALIRLWNRESGWRTSAANPSGAFGIPQALPGRKMATAGANWRTSAATQITWGLRYIRGVYGSPRSAWAHSQGTGWY